MAIFSKNTLTQISGFDNPIIAGELVWEQQTYWNLTFKNASTGDAYDLTGATLDAQILRRNLSNIRDTRYGLTFDIADFDPEPDPVNLTITNVVEENGAFTLVINDADWEVLSSSVQLDINAENCVGFSGRIKISMPEQGTTPAQDLIIFLLFLMRSGGRK